MLSDRCPSHVCFPRSSHMLRKFYWYKVYVLRTSYIEKCLSYYLCVTWVENPYPENCGLVGTIVVLGGSLNVLLEIGKKFNETGHSHS